MSVSPLPSTAGSPLVRRAHYDGIKAFSETDFTDDLKALAVPTLVMHGDDDDQIVPIADSALLSAKLLKNGPLKVYEKLAHTIFAQALDRSRAVTALESMGYTPRHRWGCRAAGGLGPTRTPPINVIVNWSPRLP